MTFKKLFSFVTLSFLLALQIVPVQAIAEDLFFEDFESEPEEELDYYETTFIISAYYSPLPGQSYYTTGSYEGDIRLNGNGTNGADGTPVYPGMIAAPKKYDFGTKMHIPGIGMTTVHDRGGAIVHAGERGYSWDRLDVWMGYGDAGLSRALSWGKREITGVLVYGVRPDIDDNVYLEGYSAAEAFVQENFLPEMTFNDDLFFGMEGDEIIEMQDYLVEWGYLEEVTGFYGKETVEALIQFQLDFEVIDSPEQVDAGYFGINTRKQFDNLILGDEDPVEAVMLQRGSQLITEKYTDLYEESFNFNSALELGDSGAAVTRLQEELSKLGYYGLEPNGQFDEITQHAVFKFQQSQGLVSAKEDAGAGYVGPATRRALNTIMGERTKAKSLIAYQREEVDSGRHIVQTAPEMVATVKEEDL